MQSRRITSRCACCCWRYHAAVTLTIIGVDLHIIVIVCTQAAVPELASGVQAKVQTVQVSNLPEMKPKTGWAEDDILRRDGRCGPLVETLPHSHDANACWPAMQRGDPGCASCEGTTKTTLGASALDGRLHLQRWESCTTRPVVLTAPHFGATYTSHDDGREV
jgi:hypothetical protein